MLSLRTLLHDIVDYAGLFPPAALDMPSAVREYADQRAGAAAWMLGRFVVPTGRLVEFETVAAPLLPRDGGEPWRIAALAGPDAVADVAAIDFFNARHAGPEHGRAVVDTLEARAGSRDEILRLGAALPPTIARFVEIPISGAIRPLVEAVRDAGLLAKVRTGGLTPDAFPAARDLARFIADCVALDVPFKATAGLHHPLRSERALTYAPDAPRGTMFGFLNVFLAAALRRAGGSEAEMEALLEERDPAALRFTDAGVRWRDRDIPLDAIAATRERQAISFGSCSFREPVEDLQAMGLLT